MFIILAMMIVLFFIMSRNVRKAQRQQMERRSEALVIGNNVVTQSGFFGRIVDIDGDAVTLESPSGDETVWLKTAIMAQMDIPLAQTTMDELLVADEDTDVVADADFSDNEGEAADRDDIRNGSDTAGTDQPGDLAAPSTHSGSDSTQEHGSGRITNVSPFSDDNGTSSWK
ncbi:preprotein translocase subunit YajC [Trueperella sp. LYQ141]|uniref:preprotein translocase subunit YajC n=1 Tax=Trueperella sp. LYQ141 TaxID=3391058 RepID=UPI00398359CB